MKTMIVVLSILAAGTASADKTKKKSFRKVQEVNFSEMSLKGELRNPDGSYLVQKKGVKFLPLYEVQKNFDEKIRNSANLVE